MHQDRAEEEPPEESRKKVERLHAGVEAVLDRGEGVYLSVCRLHSQKTSVNVSMDSGGSHELTTSTEASGQPIDAGTALDLAGDDSAALEHFLFDVAGVIEDDGSVVASSGSHSCH